MEFFVTRNMATRKPTTIPKPISQFQAALGADSAQDADDEGGATGGAGRAGAALEATGEKIDPTRLDVFREFVNSLDAEGDQRGGAGPSS